MKKLVICFVFSILFLASVVEGQQIPSPYPQNPANLYALGSPYTMAHTAATTDLNADGIDDLLVIVSDASMAYWSIDLVDGGTGNIINQISLGITGNRYLAIEIIDDINGDGTDEFAFTELRINTPNIVHIYDGFLQTSIASIQGIAGISLPFQFGKALANVGDINNDGIPDIAIGDPLFSTPANPGFGRVYIYDILSQSIIAQVGPLSSAVGPSSVEFGHTISEIGDTNGDGFPDIVIGDQALPCGQVYVYSLIPAAPALINYIPPSTILCTPGGPNPQFGTKVLANDDLDLDGINDIVVTADEGNAVFVYSGSTANVIAYYLGSVISLAIYPKNVFTGDITGDGIADLIIPGTSATKVYAGPLSFPPLGPPIPTYQFLSSARPLEMGDITGDEIEELIVPWYPPNIAYFKLGGVKIYGAQTSFPVTWTPIPPSGSNGIMAISGFNPGENVYFALSSAPVSGWPLPGSGDLVLVDPNQLLPAGAPINQQLFVTQADYLGNVNILGNLNIGSVNSFYGQAFINRNGIVYSSQAIEIKTTP